MHGCSGSGASLQVPPLLEPCGSLGSRSPRALELASRLGSPWGCPVTTPTSVPRWAILRHLSQLRQGDTIAGIAAACEYPSALACERAIHRLRSEGLVSTTIPELQRVAQVTLTTKGARALQRSLLKQGLSTLEFEQTFWAWLLSQRKAALAARRAAAREGDAAQAQHWAGHAEAYSAVLAHLEAEVSE